LIVSCATDLDSTEVNLFGQNNYTEESDSFGQEFTLNVVRDNYSLLAGAMYFEEELFGEVLVPLTNFCFFAAPATCGTPVGDFLNSGEYRRTAMSTSPPMRHLPRSRCR
jgi:iron complex outermembrane receptor protein